MNKRRVALSISDLTNDQAKKWAEYVQPIADSIELKRPRDRIVNEWLTSLSPEKRKKLSEKDLIEADTSEAKVEFSLSHYLNEYFGSRKTDIKEASWISYNHTWKRLNEFFKGRSLQSITAIEAKQFRKWLETSNKRDKPAKGELAKPLAINTIKRRTGLCRQIFKQAVEDGLIARNPFVGMSTSVRSNKERQHYIP